MQQLSHIYYVANWKSIEETYRDIGRDSDLRTKDTLQSIELVVGSAEYVTLTRILTEKEIKFSERFRKAFSREELLEAKYLRLAAGNHFGYPYPEKTYQSECYDMTRACAKCSNGAPQVKPFRLRAIPSQRSARKCGVMFINWVFEPIVPDDLAVKLDQAGLLGAELWPLLKSNSSAKWDGWSQLYITNILPPMSDRTVCERNKSPEEIDDPWIRDMLQKSVDMTWCDCGRLGWSPPETIIYNQSDMGAFRDFNRTAEWRGGGRTTWSEIIVSHRAYAVMSAFCNNIDFLFEPVQWIANPTSE